MQFDVFIENKGQSSATIVQKDPLIVRYVGDAIEQENEAERKGRADVTLAGRALSDGRPLAGVTLILNRSVPVGKMGSRNVEVARTETDPSGKYRLIGLKAMDQYSIDVLPPFPASDPTWHHQSPWVAKLPSDAKEVFVLPDLKLKKLSQSLAGIVVDPKGNPVAGVSISAHLRNGFQSIVHTSKSNPPPWTTSDRDGKFQLVQLPDEPLAIMAHIQSKEGGPIRNPVKLNVGLNEKDIRIEIDPKALDASGSKRP
jgi:hypothetical protein